MHGAQRLQVKLWSFREVVCRSWYGITQHWHAAHARYRYRPGATKRIWILCDGFCWKRTCSLKKLCSPDPESDSGSGVCAAPERLWNALESKVWNNIQRILQVMSCCCKGYHMESIRCWQFRSMVPCTGKEAKSASGHVRLTNITISAARASPALLHCSFSTATTSFHTHRRTLKSSPSLHSSTMLASKMTTQTAAPLCHFQPTGECFRARDLVHLLLRIYCIALLSELCCSLGQLRAPGQEYQRQADCKRGVAGPKLNAKVFAMGRPLAERQVIRAKSSAGDCHICHHQKP